MDWSPEQIADLTRLWGEGQTASEIGTRLGLTKGSVVGKAHRLHLPARPNPCKPQGREKRPARATGQPWQKSTKVNPTPQQPDQTAVQHRRAFFVALGTNGHACGWLDGDDRKHFRRCALPAVIDYPFCPDHCARAYLAPKKPLHAPGRPPDPAGISHPEADQDGEVA